MVNRMQKTLEFFFDFGSPTSYLAFTQMPKIAADAGAMLVWRPMLLGGVFKATGNASPVSVPAKGKWMFSDMKLWAQHYGVPLKFNPHFPINTLSLMRGAVGFQMRQPQEVARYVDVVYRALWELQLNLGDQAVLAACLSEAGFSAEDFLALTADAEVKAKLLSNTEEAVSRGVFGAPTCFVGNQMFFGQDRLDFIRAALV